MKDILSAFNTDVFRPVITLLVPGALGVSTWVIAVLQHFLKIRTAAEANQFESAMVVMVVVLFASMVIENWGSYIESKILDRLRNKATHGQFEQEWNEYLLIAYKADAEPVARRYLRGLLQHLKFELHSGVACLVASPGLIFIEMAQGWRLALGAFGLVFGLYMMFWEAKQTHQLMGEVRHNMLTNSVRILTTEVDRQGTVQSVNAVKAGH